MRIQEVIDALECFAPLSLQDSYDNAGLQIGLTEVDASGVLLCLDVTEDVLLEAVRTGCNMVVSHHPLLFRGLKQISDQTQPARCARMAIEHGLCIYAAHTNLDNARGGVNYEMADRLGARVTGWLRPLAGGEGGSGVMAELPEAEEPLQFLRRVKQTFGVHTLCHNDGPADRPIRRLALCGGAGDFLMDDALAQGADCFLTGEMHYHQYFGQEQSLWIGVLGHYQSERFTIDLLERLVRETCPGLPTRQTTVDTNAIRYL